MGRWCKHEDFEFRENIVHSNLLTRIPKLLITD